MSQNTGLDVGQRLKNEIPRIMKLWDEQVRVSLPSTRNLNELTLTNYLPVFLEMLSEVLIHGINLKKELDAKEVSKEHGKQCARVPDYSISQIFLEYNILRKTVFQVLEIETLLGMRERNLILDFIAKGKDESGAEFVGLRPVETVAHTEELTSIFLQAPVAICVLDGPDHIFTFSNPLYEQLVKREVLGKKVRDVFTEGEVAPFFKLLDRVYETGEPYIGKEASVPFHEADNQIRERFIDFSFQPLLDFQGRIKAILAILIDVTEKVMVRKENELSAKKLAIEQLKFAAILAQAPGAVAVFVGPDHVFQLANHIYLSLFFGDRDDLLGRPVREAVPEAVEQGFVALLDRVYQTGEPCSGTEVPIDLKQADGTMKSFHINFVYQPLLDSEGNIEGIIAVVIDATTHVLTKKALEKANQELLAEQDLRERFVSTLSHDLRTPLTAAKMSAQLLVRNMSDPLQIQKIAGRIAESMDRADQMIRDLLDVGQIKAGAKISLNIEDCNLNEITQSSLDDLASIHGDRFRLYSTEQINGYWDCTAIRRIIENLLGNAVKYGTPKALITIGLRQKMESIEIAVHNEGNPIPLEDQALLFRQFQRTESALKSSQKGWGIGLTLVQGFAEAHGGNVLVKSEAGEGTTFIVELPKDSRGSSS